MKRPENVIIMRHVYFEGLAEGSYCKLAQTAQDARPDPDEPSSYDLRCVYFPTWYLEGANGVINLEDFAVQKLKDTAERFGYQVNSNEFIRLFQTHLALQHAGVFKDDGAFEEYYEHNEVPKYVYRGTHCPGKIFKKESVVTNTGHMGTLDHPDMADRLFGSFVYNANPNPNPA